MKVTLLKSVIDNTTTVHGVYANRKRALKVLRYIFEREYKYHRTIPKFQHTVNCKPIECYPYYFNSQRNMFSTMFEMFWLETYEVKK